LHPTSVTQMSVPGSSVATMAEDRVSEGRGVVIAFPVAEGLRDRAVPRTTTDDDTERYWLRVQEVRADLQRLRPAT
jgi:hypothetical protein